MTTTFPRAVVWDASKACHVIIHVQRAGAYFVYTCLDCSTADTYPLEWLDKVREYIRTHDDAQVLLWVEEDGR